MRLLFFLLLAGGLGLLPGAAHAQAPAWWWGKSCGFGSITATVADGTGNTYIAGRFEGLAGFDTTLVNSAGGFDLFVAKLHYDGFCEWAVRAGGPADETVTSMALDAAGNLVVAGEYTGPTITFGAQTLTNPGTGPALFVVRLARNRTWQMAAGAGGPGPADVRLTSLALDASGNTYITGTTTKNTLVFGSQTLTASGQYGDGFVAKLGASGAWQWVRDLGGDSTVAVLGVAPAPAGEVYVTGSFGGGTVTVGTTTLSGAPTGAAFLAWLNAAGAWQGAQVVGAPGAARATGIVVDTVGDVVLVGAFANSIIFRLPTGNRTLFSAGDLDTFVAKWSPALNGWQWVATAGGAGPDVPSAVALNVTGSSLATNHIFLTGTFASPTATFGGTLLHYTATGSTPGGADVFAARLSDTGYWYWAVQTVSAVAAPNLAHDLAVDYAGQVVVAGSFLSPSLQLGSASLLNPATGQPLTFFGRINYQATGLPDDDDAARRFVLFPNPAHHAVQLTNAPAPTATIVDALGRTVRTSDLAPLTSNLDLVGLAPGLYVVRCGGATQRLVVE